MKNNSALPARGRPRPRPLQGRAEQPGGGRAPDHSTDRPARALPLASASGAGCLLQPPRPVQPSGCQARLNLTSPPHGRSPHQDAVSPGSRPRETCEVQRKNGPEYGAKGRGAQETPRGQDAHPPSPSPEPGCDSLMQRADFQEGPRC